MNDVRCIYSLYGFVNRAVFLYRNATKQYFYTIATCWYTKRMYVICKYNVLSVIASAHFHSSMVSNLSFTSIMWIHTSGTHTARLILNVELEAAKTDVSRIEINLRYLGPGIKPRPAWMIWWAFWDVTWVGIWD